MPNTRRFTTGRQIKAARALLGWDAPTLGRACGLHRNAVSRWETRDRIPPCEPVACRLMREALGKAGIEVFSDPLPGVRMIAPGKAAPSEAPGARRPFSHQYTTDRQCTAPVFSAVRESAD